MTWKPALQVVRMEPGIGVREVVGALRAVRHGWAVSMLRHLTESRRLDRHSWGRKHCLFEPRPDLDDWWMQAAALRDDGLRHLYELILEDQAWTLAQLRREAQRRLGWDPEATRARLRRLVGAGLACDKKEPAYGGKQSTHIRAMPIHVSAQEAVGQIPTKGSFATDLEGNA